MNRSIADLQRLVDELADFFFGEGACGLWTAVHARLHPRRINPAPHSATRRQDLCAWDANVHEPRSTCTLTKEKVSKFIDEPMQVRYRPVHGQSMERCVKQVTRACENVFGASARGGLIEAGVPNRQLMPVNSTKNDIAKKAKM